MSKLPMTAFRPLEIPAISFNHPDDFSDFQGGNPHSLLRISLKLTIYVKTGAGEWYLPRSNKVTRVANISLAASISYPPTHRDTCQDPAPTSL